jgi:DNA-binding winged helix-turn-helix (wHTH) protein
VTDGGLAPTISIPGFRIDARRRRLISAETADVVQLGSRSFDALLHLASRPGVLVSKAELMAAIWPDVIVEQNSLAQCISALRKALGEQPGQHHYIATEPGRGYRFIAESARPRPLSRGLTTSNPLAFQAYVTGWSALTRPDGGNLRRGLAELERAARLDPAFALAHVCVADGYALLGVFGIERPAAVFPAAKAAVSRALEIAPTSPRPMPSSGTSRPSTTWTSWPRNRL